MNVQEGNYFQNVCNFYRGLNRELFIGNDYKEYAGVDKALPIGYGQTISQPSLVVEMTIELDLNKDLKVLEIGTGSGYQTAFLAKFAGEVYTIERISELSQAAEKRLAGLGYGNVKFKIGDGSEGWEEFAPFDRIVATAGVRIVPHELKMQLAPDGKMLIPVGEKETQELLLFSKDKAGKLNEESLGKVQFVEFKGKYGWH